MKREIIFWTAISGVAFIFSALFIALMLWATHAGWVIGANGPFVRFAISIALGISVATLTVGGLRAFAAISGAAFGFNIEIGGALAAIALTVGSAIYVTQQDGFTQGFYIIDVSTRQAVESDVATVIIQVDSGPIQKPVGPSGYVEFKDLPGRILNSQQNLTLNSDQYVIMDGHTSVRLTGEPIKLEVQKNNAVVREFKKRLHLNLLGLYAPLRVLAGSAYGNFDEAHAARFNDPEVFDALINADLRSDPGQMTYQQLSKLFIYLSVEPTWRNELLNATGSHNDRLARAALRFSDYFNDLSMTGRRYLSPEAMEAINKLRNTLFIERMKNSVGLSQDQVIERIPPLELKQLVSEMINVERIVGPLDQYLVQY